MNRAAVHAGAGALYALGGALRHGFAFGMLS